MYGSAQIGTKYGLLGTNWLHPCTRMGRRSEYVPEAAGGGAHKGRRRGRSQGPLAEKLTRAASGGRRQKGRYCAG
jgi:hypothetical protein